MTVLILVSVAMAGNSSVSCLYLQRLNEVLGKTKSLRCPKLKQGVSRSILAV